MLEPLNIVRSRNLKQRAAINSLRERTCENINQDDVRGIADTGDTPEVALDRKETNGILLACIQLRTIKNIVRLGHLQRIEHDRVVLDCGTIAATSSVLYIDCTADGLERRPPVAVFDGNRMTLQTVRGCQQVFSAAFIAHVEAAYCDDAVKNELLRAGISSGFQSRLAAHDHRLQPQFHALA